MVSNTAVCQLVTQVIEHVVHMGVSVCLARVQGTLESLMTSFSEACAVFPKDGVLNAWAEDRTELVNDVARVGAVPVMRLCVLVRVGFFVVLDPGFHRHMYIMPLVRDTRQPNQGAELCWTSGIVRSRVREQASAREST